MTSILTNLSSISALQALRASNSALSDTQQRVSSGLRVATASDNVAYWSISTTMKSDNKANGAAEDALGVGRAKIDTAYAGMSEVIDILGEFQAKLVTAKEPSVDKAQIQSELSGLQQQTKSIAQSASFNGINWLQTGFEDLFNEDVASDSIVSSFSRDPSGQASVKSMGVSLYQTSLFNSDGGGGILEVDPRSPGTIGGLRNSPWDQAFTGSSASALYNFVGPMTFTDNSNSVSFTLTVDADNPASTPGAQNGVQTSYTIDRDTVDQWLPASNGVVANASQWAYLLDKVLSGTAGTGDYMGQYVIQTDETSARGSSYHLDSVSSTLSDGGTGGLLIDGLGTIYGQRAFGISAWDGPFEIKPTVEVYVATTVNNVDKTVTLTEDTVKAALGSQDGKVQTMQDFMDVLNYAFDQQGVGIIASQNFSNVVRYDPDTTIHPESGAKTNIGVRGAGDNLGTVANINFMDIDITTANNLDLFIDNVQSMLQRATDGAAVLGSLKTRADAQSDYNQKIMDYTQSGVSRLVDANMEEESAKLQAQQTQQQLALQALTIANAAPQSIMTLFQ